MSMVAIRERANCMQSKAIKMVTAAAARVFWKRVFPKAYITGNIRIPKTADIKRQPKGFMPKRRIPQEIIVLPRGGWVVS